MLLKHTTRTVPAVVERITYRTDFTIDRKLPGGEGLAANDIGGVRIRTAEPLAADGYAENRRTGSFLLIDPQGGETLSAGMVETAPDGGGNGGNTSGIGGSGPAPEAEAGLN